MSKARQKARKNKKTSPQQSAPQQSSIKKTNFISSFRQLLIFGKTVGPFVGVCSFIGLIWGAYQNLIPEVVAEASDSLAPFAQPFTVKNEGFFPMKNARMVCNIDYLKNTDGGGIYGLELTDEDTVDIAPKVPTNFRCRVGTSGLGGNNMLVAQNLTADKIVALHIYVYIEYEIFGYPLVSPRTEFTWITNTKTPRWIRGKFQENMP